MPIANPALAPVLCSRPAEGVTMITLNRPSSLNALEVGLVARLHAALDEVEQDDSCRVLILTGAGRAFCAGLDLKGYGDDDLVAAQGRLRRTYTRQVDLADLARRLHHLRQPVIAAINGPAAGGGLGLALACDIRVATDTAVFACSFIRVGYSGCDIAASWLLPRIVGTGRAHELMLTGRTFDVREALEIGLLSGVVTGDQLLPTVLEKAAQIVLNPPLSVELTKQGMWMSVETPSFDAAVAFENRQQTMTAFTEDQPEATRAFLAKDTPHYRYR